MISNYESARLTLRSELDVCAYFSQSMISKVNRSVYAVNYVVVSLLLEAPGRHETADHKANTATARNDIYYPSLRIKVTSGLED